MLALRKKRMAGAHPFLRGGFRSWFDPTGPADPASTNPTDGASFRVFAVNVPGDQPLAKIEVLDTPQGYAGLPPDPTVLLTRE